jgi:hypothetical protein
VCAERVGYRFCDTGNADIPGDVALSFSFIQSEIAERARDRAPIVIAGQKEQRGTVMIALDHGRGFVGGKQRRDVLEGHGRNGSRHGQT